MSVQYPKNQTRLFRCVSCGAEKRMILQKTGSGFMVTVQVVKAFEADGWLLMGDKKAACPDHNLLLKMEAPAV